MKILILHFHMFHMHMKANQLEIVSALYCTEFVLTSITTFQNNKFLKGVRQEDNLLVNLFIWFFYVAFNTVQVISQQKVGRAEETST